jgi:O-acetyl-ADP-ribose deacetylase (regulator of RNase III)
MTVREYDEDIFASPVQSLVVPTNVIGPMGKGLALEFKKRVPGLARYYKHLCVTGSMKADSILRYKWPGSCQQVICLPTKTAWWASSDPDMVERNIFKLANNLQRLEIESLAIPPVGCGLGGLDYFIVREFIEDAFCDKDIEVRIVLGKK